MLYSDRPALILAPMDGITDAPMRALQGETGAFTFAVSEFLRVSADPLPSKVFKRDVPELLSGGRTRTGMPVQVQILGGHPERMAISAVRACKAGALGIDINFGCPAPTVNRHDGGAAILNHPCRIREIVSAVRAAVPPRIPVSAKVRLGWDNTEQIYENAVMAQEGGAAWLTIHGRTKAQGYAPPIFWSPIGEVRRALNILVIANGDIWNLDDFKRCQDLTGCKHYMLGRGALANPALPYQVAQELGIYRGEPPKTDWAALFRKLLQLNEEHYGPSDGLSLRRLKQWTRIANNFGDFPAFQRVKHANSVHEFFHLMDPAAVA